MKTLIKIFLILHIFNISTTSCVFFDNPALAERTYYAQIVTSNVYLYSTPTDLSECRLFIIPITYFVELLNSADDNFYEARYNDVYGYVKKGDVKPVTTPPASPFLTNINFRVFVPSGANLRTTPQNNGTINLICSIPFLDLNLSYYGICEGEESISKKGNIWYYCKYYLNNNHHFGYVYSPLCDELTPIVNNTESVEYLTEPPKFKEETNSESINQLDAMPQTTQTIIIIAVSLPCLLFIYLLFKPTRLAEENSATTTTKTKHKPKTKKAKYKRLKNSDYFELDDNF